MRAAEKATRAELVMKVVCRRNLDRLVSPASQHRRTNSGQDAVQSNQVGWGAEEVEDRIRQIVVKYYGLYLCPIVLAQAYCYREGHQARQEVAGQEA
jgi:hypothetical protein